MSHAVDAHDVNRVGNFVNHPVVAHAAASPIAALGLKVHDRMAGMFLAFARLGKEAVHVASVGRGESLQTPSRPVTTAV